MHPTHDLQDTGADRIHAHAKMSLNGLLRTCVHADAPTYEARASTSARAYALIACGQHACKQERLTTETAHTLSHTQYLKQKHDAEQGEPEYRGYASRFRVQDLVPEADT